MGTRLLGKIVWSGAKWYLRRRLGVRRSHRRGLAVGAAAAVGVGLVAVAAARRQAA